MSYSIEFDAERKIFRTEFWGKVTLEEINVSDREMLASPDWPGSRKNLTHLRRGADMSSVTHEGLLTVTLPYMRESQEIRGAHSMEAWMIDDPFNFSVVQLWELMPSTPGLQEFQVFEHEHDALQWLADGVVTAPSG
jgi:hypothetical protein